MSGRDSKRGSARTRAYPHKAITPGGLGVELRSHQICECQLVPRVPPSPRSGTRHDCDDRPESFTMFPRASTCPQFGKDDRRPNVRRGVAGAIDLRCRGERDVIAVEAPHARLRRAGDHPEVGWERGHRPRRLGPVPVVDGDPTRSDPLTGSVQQRRHPISGRVAKDGAGGRLADHRRIGRGRIRAGVPEELVQMGGAWYSRKHDGVVRREMGRLAIDDERLGSKRPSLPTPTSSTR
jgi:hypothetical protein